MKPGSSISVYTELSHNISMYNNCHVHTAYTGIVAEQRK